MTIQEAIRILASTSEELYCKVCVVDTVDEQTRTIDCSPLDESAPLLGVNLQANQGNDQGLVLFPAVGSYVVVAFLGRAAASVILTERVDKIAARIGDQTMEMTSERTAFNGGHLGGMIVVGDLTKRLNQLKSEFNAFVDVFNSHTHTTTATVGATTTVGVLMPPSVLAAEATCFGCEDYENLQVKH